MDQITDVPRPIDRQRGRVEINIGSRGRISAEVDISSTGLLSIGALVAMTLLSTAAIVRVATDARRRTTTR